MAYFLFEGSYTPASLASLIQNPEDRSLHIKGIVESFGGKLDGFWLAFGDRDFVLIAQLPDPQTAAAFAIAAGAGGGVQDFKTVPLLTWAEGINAFKQAARAGYRPPTTPGR